VPDDNNRARSTNVDVMIAGAEVPDDEVIRFVVDMDLNQADMAVITLKNAGNRHSNAHKQGDAVEIKVTGDKKTIFKGEIVGVEPVFEAGADSKCVIRAFNRLHRLLRGRKSRTFQDQADNAIVNTIVGDHGLSAQCGSDVNITHKHVYQHNQTDLEFLRTRAARIGYSVWVDDQTLHFEKPKLDKDSGIELKITTETSEKYRIKRFAPRMSSAGVVKKVTVRGWDPEKKQEIVGEVSASGSKLGATNAAAAANVFGETKTFTVDHPIASVEEAKAIAQSKLDEYMMSYITGEAECFGHPDYKAGIVVKITVNQEQNDDLFNGKYFITGCAHMYSHAAGGGGGGGTGGYTTVLKVARDAEKGQ
jgi:Bacteriophage probable baseplate hub protein